MLLCAKTIVPVAFVTKFKEVELVMVRVRLKRTGTRNAACFRIVVMDQRSSRDGKAIEELGFYNPRSKEEKINIERLLRNRRGDRRPGARRQEPEGHCPQAVSVEEGESQVGSRGEGQGGSGSRCQGSRRSSG